MTFFLLAFAAVALFAWGYSRGRSATSRDITETIGFLSRFFKGNADD